MLAAFDVAKQQCAAHEVQTYHGRVAEDKFRSWLSEFLPKRYGVTAGYIVAQHIWADDKLPHYDVIVYDQIESPVLWVEDGMANANGQSRAVPAEHVRAVFEVKSSFESSTVTSAVEHLFDLEPLLRGVDPPDESYPKFLHPKFFSAVVVFELKKQHEFSRAALNAIVPETPLPGYTGGIILRGEGLPPDLTGRLALMQSDAGAIESTVGRDRNSLLVGCAVGDSKLWHNSVQVGATLIWSDVEFAWFAFDVVARLSGTYKQGFVSSWHGLTWVGR